MALINQLNLKNRVALVTGAAGGMGRAISAELAALGATVVMADRTDAVEQMAAALNADWMAFDVTNSASVDQGVADVVARHGRLDILIANAGVAYEEHSLAHTDEAWRKVMSINLDGVFFTMRACARHMASTGGGSIVAISSIAGVKAVRPEVHIGYDVSKAGVVHMCRNLAVEWAKLKIRVNAVGPGYTATAMLKEVGESNPAVMQQWMADVPLGRLMAPEEVAQAVAFLASDAASGITGHNLMVDGAYSVA